MDNLSIIDLFLEKFTTLIDSGFGLLGPDVHFLTTILIGIDIVLAGLFWAFSPNINIMGQFLKKVLYVGFFAWIITNFAFLSTVVFDSFAALGIRAGNASFTVDDLMRPGFVAFTGFQAGTPLLNEIGELTGPVRFFVNIVTIGVLFVSWLIVIFSFFILAIQLFITIIEFKLTSLAGFILIPFALWNKTTFLAERVLGNVVTSGIKLMLLSLILAIGSTIFADLTATANNADITLVHSLSIVLGSLTLLGLGIFGPSIASGLISGAPQLGAGAALGTAATAAAGGALAGGAAVGAAKLGGGAVKAAASVSGGAATSYSLGKAASGAGGVQGAIAGATGVAQAGGSAALNQLKRPFRAIKNSFDQGSAAAFAATGGSSTGGSVEAAGSGGGGSSPNNSNWARKFQRRQQLDRATSSIKDGDRGSGGANPNLTDREE